MSVLHYHLLSVGRQQVLVRLEDVVNEGVPSVKGWVSHGCGWVSHHSIGFLKCRKPQYIYSELQL